MPWDEENVNVKAVTKEIVKETRQAWMILSTILFWSWKALSTNWMWNIVCRSPKVISKMVLSLHFIDVRGKVITLFPEDLLVHALMKLPLENMGLIHWLNPVKFFVHQKPCMNLILSSVYLTGTILSLSHKESNQTGQGGTAVKNLNINQPVNYA